MEQTKVNELKVPGKSFPPIRRVGLLSPTSGNLGNAAMQAAMIANLRNRVPGIEFMGITLNPGETSRRHGIEAFPLAAVSRPNYGLYNSGVSTAQNWRAPKLLGVRQWLKQIPILGSLLKAVRNCGKELAHFVRSARVVRKLDRIIIPGGGTLDDSWGGPWGQPWVLFKWSLLSRICGVPFLFVSIGKSSLDSRLSRFFIRVSLRLAEYRSYRDCDSKTAVQSLIDASNDPVCPDLAFSYPRPAIQPLTGNDSPGSRMVVGVSPISYCDPRVWPQKDKRRYDAYLSQLSEMVKWLLKEQYRVLFFTTDSPDIATLDDLQSMLPTGAYGADAIQSLPGSSEQSPDSLLRGISSAGLIIASRLHGVILSHLNGIPVLALSFDPKVDSHMAAVGQEKYCLSIDTLDSHTLNERFVALKAARQTERAHLCSVALRFRQLLDHQYDSILDSSPSRFRKEADAIQLNAQPREFEGTKIK
jgi:polysaccharide pyruvyl transferase WcaK-like protein